MKILHISSVRIDYPGGTEKVIWELAKRQAKNHKVAILQTNLYEEGGEFDEGEIRKGVKIITCKNDSFLGGFGYSKEFKDKLMGIWKDYDVVHIHGYGRFTSNFALKFLYRKKPIVFMAHGFFHNKKHGFFKKAHNILFKRLLRKANFCVGSTELDRKIYLGLGVNSKKIVIIPNGVELKRFVGVKKKGIKLFKKKYNLDGNTLLYVGRIHESKGLQHVVRAIKDFDCKLLIVGKDAEYKKELKDIISEAGVNEKVVFTGSLSDKDLVSAYCSCDAFVLYSRWEGFGIVVVEAMACGKPVVVSNNGSLPFLVKDMKNGLIAKNKDELKEKIELVLMSKKLREDLGKEGKKFSKGYDWDNLCEKFLDAYGVAVDGE